MISGKIRLCYTGKAVGIKTCQKDAGLHLGGAYGRIIMDSFQGPSLDLKRDTVIVPDTSDFSPHSGKGGDDPFHGPLLNRVISGEIALEGLAGQDTA